MQTSATVGAEDSACQPNLRLDTNYVAYKVCKAGRSEASVTHTRAATLNSSKHLWHDAVQQPSPAAIRGGRNLGTAGVRIARGKKRPCSDSLPKIYTRIIHQ